MLDESAPFTGCVTTELLKQFAVGRYGRQLFAGCACDDGVFRTESTAVLPGQITFEHIPVVAREYDGGDGNELNRGTLFSVASCEDVAFEVLSISVTIFG